MANQFARPPDVPFQNQSVRQCRACLFVQRLAQIVDTPATAYGLARWWRNTHGSCEEQPQQKWAAFLQGTLPQPELRGLLIAENPGLKDVLVDPLWWSLSKMSTPSAEREFWDSCAEAIELNGAPLPACTHAVVNRLCALPRWTHLGFMLILLRSGNSKFAGYRAWLQRHFFSYFSIALLNHPVDRVTLRLFHCINALVKDGSLADGYLADWPKDQQEFAAVVKCCQAAFELTRYRAWRNHWHETDDVHPLLWLLWQDAKLCDEYLATETSDEFCYECGKRTSLPNRLRMRWRRTAERARATQITFAWSRCNQGGLTPGDRRVLGRLRLEAEWIAASSYSSGP